MWISDFQCTFRLLDPTVYKQTKTPQCDLQYTKCTNKQKHLNLQYWKSHWIWSNKQINEQLNKLTNELTTELSKKQINEQMNKKNKDKKNIKDQINEQTKTNEWHNGLTN